MNKNQFFRELMGFFGNVHASSHGMLKEARSNTVPPLQHSILEYVFFNKSVTTSQIADCLTISLPNTSRELKKLLRQELLQKEICIDDRRKVSINLTEAGIALVNDTFGKLEVNFWEQVDELSDQEMSDIQLSMKLLNAKVIPTQLKNEK